MIGDGIVIDFGNAAFLRANDACEMASLVDNKRHVAMGALADRLPIFERRDERNVRIQTYTRHQ